MTEYSYSSPASSLSGKKNPYVDLRSPCHPGMGLPTAAFSRVLLRKSLSAFYTKKGASLESITVWAGQLKRPVFSVDTWTWA
jgi:hypothetical protein